MKERTTELSKSVAEMRQAELRYRTVADFTYDWEYWTNLDGTLNYISPSCDRISGYPPGGFGIGSDLALRGLALVDWQPFKYVSFLAGYRAIYQDGDGADLFRIDATMHGPVSASISFCNAICPKRTL